MPQEEIERCKKAADLSFLTQGITFTVYGEEQGTERVFPYDLLPRVISNAEWTHIERGLTQRITALNMFLHDVYNEGRILADGKVPREMVYTCRHFRREMRGLQVPRNIYIAVSGTDLLRVQSRRIRGAGRQPARAQRRELHADQPARDEAHLSPALPRVRRAADRALPAGAAGDAAVAGAGGPAGADHRAADAGRLQLGVFRAHLPGAPDGHRAGGGPRPGDPRQRRLHAHHRRTEARGRDLPARG